MGFFSSAYAQLRANRSGIVFITTLSSFLLGIVVLLSLFKQIPISQLTRDPANIGKTALYAGFLSQIGIFFWSGSAAICIFCAKVIPKSPRNFMVKLFFFVSGLFSLLLGLDDVFLLHERFLPGIGFPQKAVFASYAVFILLYLRLFFSTILKTEYILLGISLFFFALSIASDLEFIDPPGIDHLLVEDGTKLIGIVSWLTYFYHSAVSTVSQNLAQQGISRKRDSGVFRSYR